MKNSVVRSNTFSKARERICTAVEFYMWCPLVLLVQISWRQEGRSERNENKEMGSEQFEHGAEEGN
jgi:hypothetical protein